MKLDFPLSALTDRPAQPCPKGLPAPLGKEARAKGKKDKEQAFRDAVWKRDKGRDRATGKPVVHSEVDWAKVGQVHHVYSRSTSPERIYDVTNGLLLSEKSHRLAEATCPNAPDKHLLDIEGPDDRGEDQLFIWRDVHGAEVKRRVG